MEEIDSNMVLWLTETILKRHEAEESEMSPKFATLILEYLGRGKVYDEKLEQSLLGFVVKVKLDLFRILNKLSKKI